MGEKCRNYYHRLPRKKSVVVCDRSASELGAIPFWCKLNTAVMCESAEAMSEMDFIQRRSERATFIANCGRQSKSLDDDSVFDQ